MLYYLLLLLFAGIAQNPPASQAAQPPEERELSRMAGDLASLAATRRIRLVAVTDFLDSEGQPSPISRLFSLKLAAALAQHTSPQLLDRPQFLKLLKANHLGDTTNLSAGELKILHDRSPLEGIVTGTVAEDPKGTYVLIKLISTKTGTVVGATTAIMPNNEHPVEDRTSTDSPPLTPEGMAFIPAGPFLFGDSHQARTIDLPDFWIDLFEVTNEDYAKIRGHKFDEAEARHPVTDVSWKQAQLYCQALGKRLPTEQEWEKAARGTDGRRLPWGDEPSPEQANIGHRHKGTTPVGQFPEGRSPYGVHDMAGNVREWTASEREGMKVFRGSSWATSLQNSQITVREWIGPRHGLADLGFRCAQDGTAR